MANRIRLVAENRLYLIEIARWARIVGAAPTCYSWHLCRLRSYLEEPIKTPETARDNPHRRNQILSLQPDVCSQLDWYSTWPQYDPDNK